MSLTSNLYKIARASNDVRSLRKGTFIQHEVRKSLIRTVLRFLKI